MDRGELSLSHSHRGNFRREYSLHICSLHNQATTKLGWSTNTVTSVLNIILLPVCLWQSTVYLVHYSSFTHSKYYTPRGELKDSHKQSSLHVGIGIIQPPNYAMKFEDWAWRIVWLYDKTIITMWQTISEKKIATCLLLELSTCKNTDRRQNNS